MDRGDKVKKRIWMQDEQALPAFAERGVKLFCRGLFDLKELLHDLR